MQPPLATHIRQIGEILETVPDCLSIWLLGSTARGEASYLQRADGRLELFSDYEFMVVVPTRPPQPVRQQLDEQIAAWEQAFHNPNPLFHIDVILRERRRLAKMAPIVFTYEMRQNARLLYGEDNRDQLPGITLEALNLRDANEILYKRFWAILFYLPRRFLSGKVNAAERRVAGYLLCRNALDLTTVLLPREGILLPTYRQRVERLAADYPHLNLRRYFDADFPAFLAECLERRQSLDFEGDDLTARYARVIRYLAQGLHCVLDSTAPLAQALPVHSRSIFNEWGISRGEAYNQARLALSLVRHRGPRAALRWLLAPKRGYLTLGLWSMHQALIAHLQGDAAEARRWLAESRQALLHVAVENVGDLPGDFDESWLAMRRSWADFWREYNLMTGDYYRQRFESILEWSYDEHADPVYR